MKIVLATRNRKKVEELQRAALGRSLELVTLDAYPDCPDVVEDGQTFRENAIKKAVAVARFTGCAALADDSGLEVEALAGRPGVHSARYARVGATDSENVARLLEELAGVEESARQARFVCVLAMAGPDGRVEIFEGTVSGRIGYTVTGTNGFGYDPVFFPEGEKRTFAEMEGREKDAMSHRGRALASWVAALDRWLV
ncbi:MAG: XTP/dITP diphosphatase [Magnetococcales bacterium]|nr:XTP/dITP diphosphatase [Magnetococcales bacterium]